MKENVQLNIRRINFYLVNREKQITDGCTN